MANWCNAIIDYSRLYRLPSLPSSHPIAYSHACTVSTTPSALGSSSPWFTVNGWSAIIFTVSGSTLALSTTGSFVLAKLQLYLTFITQDNVERGRLCLFFQAIFLRGLQR